MQGHMNVKLTPDDGQRNCPKHVEFNSKNKFEKLVHLVGFVIRIYHDARPQESTDKEVPVTVCCQGKPPLSGWFLFP